MSKHYIYIMTSSDRSHLHCGYCKDVVRMQKWYDEMPSTHFLHENYRQNILVWLEEANNLQDAKLRLEQFMGFTQEQKTALIDSCNPQWVELIPGVNIEL